MPATVSESSYEENLKLLGDVDLASPKSINIYASTFADKDAIADAIEAYNNGVSEDDQIDYTDYVALLMSSVTTIINAISYVLIAFVAISLVVSSIMIGIITYISVHRQSAAGSHTQRRTEQGCPVQCRFCRVFRDCPSLIFTPVIFNLDCGKVSAIGVSRQLFGVAAAG